MGSSNQPLPTQQSAAIGCSIVGYNFANWTFSEALRSMADIGICGVETHCPHSMRQNGGAGMARMLRNYELMPLTYLTGGYGIDLGVGLFASVDKPDRLRAIQAYDRELALASDLGFPAMIVFLDLSPTQTDHLSGDRLRAAETLGVVAEMGRQRGVKIVVETYSGSLAYDAQSFLSIREAAGSANIYANVDPSNYQVVGADVVASIHQLGDLVAGVHLKDVLEGTYEQPRWAPPGSGSVNWANVISALNHIGYGGAMVVEYEAGISGAFPIDAERGARLSADYIRGICQEVDGEH
jgi:sugar phosphate isomerase/epimerase